MCSDSGVKNARQCAIWEAEGNSMNADRRRLIGGVVAMAAIVVFRESGTFTGMSASNPAVSTVGALIIATHRLPQLFRKYARLRANLPKPKGEVKGSLLNESQVASVIEILRKNGAIFCASMIDLAEHTTKDIAQHRARQSASLTANLTNGHTQELRDGIAGLQKRTFPFQNGQFDSEARRLRCQR